MIVYCSSITPRLRYIFDFVGIALFGKPFPVTESKEEFSGFSGQRINYSQERVTENEFWLRPHSLLFEKGIKQQKIDCIEDNKQKIIFKTEGDLSFDIFAASFYLLSRYEEYLPHQKDRYGRYAHENSLAFNNGFLHLPLVNIWIENFRKVLIEKYSIQNNQRTIFKFIPTYDIDEAYSYKYKSWWRSAGGFSKQLATGHWPLAKERLDVLAGKKGDPYDSFKWMDELHEKFSLAPCYFFLVAGNSSRYDKNISPSKQPMQILIRNHAKKYILGIHPSWQSGDDPEKLKLEILKLGHITGRQILLSRQHYIRFSLPETFRLLIDAGIESDFSMGYGSINGFRASVASPFYWYDLEIEKQTILQIHPFCFMEANSFFEQKFSPLQALEEMRRYRNIIKSVNGTMITVWHNTFLGTGNLFNGWREVYEQFIGEI